MVLARESGVLDPRGDPGAHRHHQRRWCAARPRSRELRREVLRAPRGPASSSRTTRASTTASSRTSSARSRCRSRADVLCTVRLSRRLYPGSGGPRAGRDHRAPWAARMRSPQTPPIAHRAPFRARRRARALATSCSCCTARRSAEEIDAAVKRLLKIPSLPPQLAPDALENLPEGPGVYRFYGVNDLPLYIGKSINLRDRVRSHFSSDYRQRQRPAHLERDPAHRGRGDGGRAGRAAARGAAGEGAACRCTTTGCAEGNACFVRWPISRSPPRGAAGASDIDWGARGPGAAALYGPFASKVHVRAMLEELAGRARPVLAPARLGEARRPVLRAPGAQVPGCLHRRGDAAGARPAAATALAALQAVASGRGPDASWCASAIADDGARSRLRLRPLAPRRAPRATSASWRICWPAASTSASIPTSIASSRNSSKDKRPGVSSRVFGCLQAHPHPQPAAGGAPLSTSGTSFRELPTRRSDGPRIHHARVGPQQRPAAASACRTATRRRRPRAGSRACGRGSGPPTRWRRSSRW